MVENADEVRTLYLNGPSQRRRVGDEVTRWFFKDECWPVLATSRSGSTPPVVMCLRQRRSITCS